MTQKEELELLRAQVAELQAKVELLEYKLQRKPVPYYPPYRPWQPYQPYWWGDNSTPVYEVLC